MSIAFVVLMLVSSCFASDNIAVVVPKGGVLSIDVKKENVFQCTGANDEAQINRASKLLRTSGQEGKLYLEYGEYNIQNRIVLDSGITVEGIKKQEAELGNRKLLKDNTCKTVAGSCCSDTGCPASSCIANGLASNSMNCNKNTCPLQQCKKIDTGCKSKCIGTIICTAVFPNCAYKGEYCFYDGNSDNFKICTEQKVTPCEVNNAVSVEGGHFVKNGATKLNIEIQKHTASFTNILQLYTFDRNTEKMVLINDNIASNKVDVGKKISIDLSKVQSEIVFAIYVKNTDRTWFMGDATRNRDNMTHSVITKQTSTSYVISFEDLEGATPWRNFDDFSFSVDITSGNVDVYSACKGGLLNTVETKSSESLVCKQANATVYNNVCKYKNDNMYPLLRFNSVVTGSTVMFQTINKKNIVLKNFNVIGDVTRTVLQSGLYFKDTENIYVENVKAIAFSRAGFRVENSNVMKVSDSASVCNNNFGFEIVRSIGVKITDNSIVQDNKIGFKIHHNVDLTIINNILMNNEYTFDLRNDTQLNVNQNTFK